MRRSAGLEHLLDIGGYIIAVLQKLEPKASIFGLLLLSNLRQELQGCKIESKFWSVLPVSSDDSSSLRPQHRTSSSILSHGRAGQTLDRTSSLLCPQERDSTLSTLLQLLHRGRIKCHHLIICCGKANLAIIPHFLLGIQLGLGLALPSFKVNSLTCLRIGGRVDEFHWASMRVVVSW